MTTALLDTCVLVPSGARDVLLEIASTGIYRPLWSTAILAELDRTGPPPSGSAACRPTCKTTSTSSDRHPTADEDPGHRRCMSASGAPELPSRSRALGRATAVP